MSMNRNTRTHTDTSTIYLNTVTILDDLQIGLNQNNKNKEIITNNNFTFHVIDIENNNPLQNNTEHSLTSQKPNHPAPGPTKKPGLISLKGSPKDDRVRAIWTSRRMMFHRTNLGIERSSKVLQESSAFPMGSGAKQPCQIL